MKPHNSPPLARWLAILVLVLAGLHCLSFSWLKWGDVIVDVGRDLDIARQIAEGRALYSQVRYFYGPLAPLLNGLLFKLFGANLAVFEAAGICVAFLSCGLLYRLARLFCGRLGSTAIAAAFLYICAFAHLAPNGIFNFVLPYTTAATYGMCAALASLYFLLRHAREMGEMATGIARDDEEGRKGPEGPKRPKGLKPAEPQSHAEPSFFGTEANGNPKSKIQSVPFFLVLSLVFLALAALTKIEILFAAALAHLVFLGCGLWMKRLSWRVLLCAYGLAFLAVAAVYGVFIHRAGLECLTRDNLFALVSQPFGYFTREKMGLVDPAASLAQMGYSLLAAASVFALAWVIHRTLGERAPSPRIIKVLSAGVLSTERPPDHERSRGKAQYSVLSTHYSFLAAAGGAGVYAFLSLELPFRLLPILCVGVLVHLLRKWGQTQTAGQSPFSERRRLWMELILWAFALGSISRLGLRVVSYHYGFYLLPAGLLVFGLLWFTYLPRWQSKVLSAGVLSTERPSGHERSTEKTPYSVLSTQYSVLNTQYSFFSAAGLGVLCALTWSHYALSARLYACHTFDLNAPRGHILLLDNLRGLRTGQYYATVVHLLSLMPAHTRVIVVPQGVGLSFLSGQDNPYGTCGYLITDVAGSYSDERLLELLHSQPPELVVHAASDTSEVGPQIFGKDYAVKSWGWIKENYEPVIQIGGGFAVIYCRKGVDFSPMVTGDK